MKKLLIASSFLATLNVFGASQIMEFDHSKEVKCYQEITNLGCTDRAGEEVSDCVETKKQKLTTECKEMHTLKRNNR